MIIKAILMAIASATTGLFNTIQSLVPDMGGLFEDMGEIIVHILSISTQAINFLHFIIGDSLIFIIPIVGALLVAKYLVLPIVDICRRLIPFVNL